MEDKCLILQACCTVCGHDEFRFAGLQWLPVTSIRKMGGTPTYIDPDQPNRAAVELYVCLGCGNSFIKL